MKLLSGPCQADFSWYLEHLALEIDHEHQSVPVARVYFILGLSWANGRLWVLGAGAGLGRPWAGAGSLNMHSTSWEECVY